ncbi:MAG TPA: spore coat U domain-containing protein [Candidatus Deferrimicrobiaceae bacterium]|jgi:spore coat protein U-like protein|nr:spore coat U domain-containing protein [Candidatus Deferrimicrobiaceae bacterium]
MNRSARVALIVGGLALGLTAPAFAQTATANLGVSATVAKNCSITTSAVAFGSYDPVVTHATSPLDGTGSVVVTCTKGAGTRIDLGVGANASGSTRRMAGGGDFLTYELYQNTGRTTVWGSGASAGQTIAAAPSRAARTFTVFGRIPAGQDVSAASYNDTVVATINF